MEAGPGTAIVRATEFPSIRAICETEEERLAYETGKIAAIESREALYDWNFGPCVDILKNHFSPITSIRSASEDYKEVIKYTKQYILGLHDNGLIATAKQASWVARSSISKPYRLFSKIDLAASRSDQPHSR